MPGQGQLGARRGCPPPLASCAPRPQRGTHPAPPGVNSRRLPRRQQRRGRRTPGVSAEPSPGPFALLPRGASSWAPAGSAARAPAGEPRSWAWRAEPRPALDPPLRPHPPRVGPASALPLPAKPRAPPPAPWALPLPAATAFFLDPAASSTAGLHHVPSLLPRPQAPVTPPPSGPLPPRLGPASSLRGRCSPSPAGPQPTGLRGSRGLGPGGLSSSSWALRRGRSGKRKRGTGQEALDRQTRPSLDRAQFFFSVVIRIQLASPK